MEDFVQLWVYLASTPLFGLTATLVVYLLATGLYVRTRHAPWANPVLLSIIALGLLLAISGTPYPTYFSGAQFIHFLLGPAVVALAWPLWSRREELRRHAGPLLIAAFVGGLAASGSAVLLGWSVGLPQELLRSLASKSVTAPVAMGIAQQIGGIPPLAAVFAVITGLIGAVSGKYLFDWLGVAPMRTRGYALGTAAHGIGAARALQVDPDAGAYAGLALGVQVIISSMLIPIVARTFF